MLQIFFSFVFSLMPLIQFETKEQPMDNIILCNEKEDDMCAIIINEKACLLISKEDNIWKWISPEDIFKMWVISMDNQKEFQMNINKYVKMHENKIKGMFILKMKENWDYNKNILEIKKKDIRQKTY